jgi:hypothetical protein
MVSTKLHKVIIPKVPDRGGRTSELQPPPPEMPAFVQRQQNNKQPQRQTRVQSSASTTSTRQTFDRKWTDQNQFGQGQKPQYTYEKDNYNQGINFRPQNDFERFQNQDYYEGPDAKRNYQDDNNYRQSYNNRGGSRGGSGRGGSRGGRNNY